MIPVHWVKLNHSKQLMANKSRAAALAVALVLKPRLPLCSRQPCSTSCVWAVKSVSCRDDAGENHLAGVLIVLARCFKLPIKRFNIPQGQVLA
jgi:hypothetical protein